MENTTHEIEDKAILEYMHKHDNRFLWDAASLARALGHDTRTYPRAEGYLYRRALRSLKRLENAKIIGRYVTTMNENVYYALSRVSRSEFPL